MCYSFLLKIKEARTKQCIFPWFLLIFRISTELLIFKTLHIPLIGAGSHHIPQLRGNCRNTSIKPAAKLRQGKKHFFDFDPTQTTTMLGYTQKKLPTVTSITVITIDTQLSMTLSMDQLLLKMGYLIKRRPRSFFRFHKYNSRQKGFSIQLSGSRQSGR